jgi:Second Messenger Oligonucleotide or Dinucleotide Synthetase domain
MAHLPEQFDFALANVEPTQGDKDHAPEVHEDVRESLDDSKSLEDLNVDTVLIGSYKRHVSIRRMKDVDVFCKVSDPGDRGAQELLDLFEQVLVSRYQRKRVERQERSLQVDFPDYDLYVDVVPARRTGAYWEIPERSGKGSEWVITNPEALTQLTTPTNLKHTLGDRGVYVPIVKLMRQTQRSHLGKHPGGLYMEVLTYWAFSDGIDGASIADYFVGALDGATRHLGRALDGGLPDPTVEGATIDTRASRDDLEQALQSLQEVSLIATRALGEPDECKAALLWQSVLGRNDEGEVFPLPDFCNPDGTRKARADVLPGERRVPAGEGRFA